MKNYKIIRIVAVLIALNIVCIPFLCNEWWSIEDISDNACTFFETLENIGDGYYSADDDVPIDILYYFGGLACALFIFISALRESSGACIFGSLLGIAMSLYLFYQVHIGPGWYVGLHDAFLTFGFYITCAGFVAVPILLPSKGAEQAD